MKTVLLLKDLSTEARVDVQLKTMSEGRATTSIWSASGTSTTFDLTEEGFKELVEYLRKLIFREVT